MATYNAYSSRPPPNDAVPPPPLPPVPPSLRVELESEYGSAPHFDDPLVAPRPHRVQPDLPANMARTLHEQTYQRNSLDSYGGALSPQPPYNQVMPGFAMSSGRGPSPAPPGWNPWSTATSPAPSHYPGTSYTPQPPPLRQEDVALSIAALSLGPQPPPNHHAHQRTPTASTDNFPQQYSQQPGSLQSQQYPRQQPSPLPPAATPQVPPQTPGPPSLTAPLPTIAGLAALLPSIRQPGYDPAQKVTWCRDVLALVNRAETAHAIVNSPESVTAADVAVGPVRIGEPQLQRLIDVAIPLIQEISSPNPMPKPTPIYIAEAIYLKAMCEASGAYPQFIKRDPRTAFRNCEYAARHGYPAAWFKIGRDYENFGDVAHAKDAFERGVKAGNERCLYRMGMANLMGQLQLPSSAAAALPLLHRAATLATVEIPQPAYVYGLLLLAEFSHISIPPHLFAPYIPQGSTPQAEARKHLERAAYLNFAPAQYKLGHSYEFATPPFPFDALLSVQYYSLASQQGETEADMALSKWFLCGSEGAFEKDEGLAWTFAEKAARKGLPNAEFAMGYYAEVGVGGAKDIEAARKWYTKAAEHGNSDARDRLDALSQPAPQSLSRAEHEQLTDSKLVRTRTQAKQRSDATGARRPVMQQEQGARIVDIVRKNSTMLPLSTIASAPPAQAGRQSAPTTQQPQPQQIRAPSLPTSPAPAHSQSQSPRPFANAPRYNLSDPGSGDGSSPRPLPSQSQPSFGPPRREGRPSIDSRPGPASPPSASNISSGPPRKGPATFAEMGITTAKAEDKDCIVM
ncbi:hypothetical protein BC835DRAFT_800284 [Cytidiella melzeri]|nr:hypothetical protein BC835DRAFT_800284 [Cytidiella melzeri]